MKTILITTTIYVPHVLERYRELDGDVLFIVAGDRKTPHSETKAFVDRLENAIYLSDKDQEALGYASSEIIGWNKIMRRNIALLEAIRQGADLIVTIDDDNVPIEPDYFGVFRALMATEYAGAMVSSELGWLNAGEFLHPAVYHRGFPYDFRHKDLLLKVEAASGRRVGVAAGLWLGDPDIDAMERLTNRPLVTDVAEMGRRGFVVEPGVWAPFNSQNTAYLGELAPLMMVLIGVGRYDDILASFIAERVMQARGLVVHFGPPLVYQERNQQDLWKNLRDELFGMEMTMQFIRDLEAAEVNGDDVLEDLAAIYRQLRKSDYLPSEVFELADAWSEDVRRVTE